MKAERKHKPDCLCVKCENRRQLEEAAPDLLNACRAALPTLSLVAESDAGESEGTPSASRARDVIDAIRAAIAKAEGKQP